MRIANRLLKLSKAVFIVHSVALPVFAQTVNIPDGGTSSGISQTESMLTVNNSGQIEGTDQYAISGDDVRITNTSTGVINSIGTSHRSIIFAASNLVINNAGTISGDTVSIESQGGMSVTNSGTISGKGISFSSVMGQAVDIVNESTGLISHIETGGTGIPVTIENAGTIGINGATAGSGGSIFISQNGANIINTGTIMGDASGLAIFADGGSMTLTLGTGSVINGRVDASLMGYNNLILTGTGTEDGSKFLGMNRLTMQGTEWTLTGDSTFEVNPHDDPSWYKTGVLVETGVLHLANGSLTASEVTVNSGATLDTGAGAYTITGNVSNAGVVTIGKSGTAGNVLNVTGSYTGTGGEVRLNTVLGDDSSVTDKLHVGGNVSGSSTLWISNVGGAGAQTVNGIQVVQVDGTSDGKSPDENTPSAGANFRLGNTVKAGAYEYLLKSNGESWYLVSHVAGTDVYRPEVSNYLSGQRINTETGMQQLSTLHQRVGEHRTLPLETQSWANVSYHHQSEEGKNRFGYKADTYGLQIGHELMARETGDGGSIRAAVAFDYARVDGDMTDRLRPKLDESLSRDTGSLKSDSWALGGYVTKIYANGAYVDMVGQIAWLRNRYETQNKEGTRDDTKQNGWRVGLSAEGGYPLWQNASNWLLEGQGQLSYQYTDYRGTSHVDSYGADALRGRLGLRMSRPLLNTEKEKGQIYTVLNVYYDFLNPEEVKINNGAEKISVSERYGRTWGEIGLGMQGWINKSTSVYGDIRYRRGFETTGENESREGGSLNIGIRHSF